ncbi:MAG: hypothetical protein WCA35_08980 [Kovacikia sp.]
MSGTDEAPVKLRAGTLKMVFGVYWSSSNDFNGNSECNDLYRDHSAMAHASEVRRLAEETWVILLRNALTQTHLQAWAESS